LISIQWILYNLLTNWKLLHIENKTTITTDLRASLWLTIIRTTTIVFIRLIIIPFFIKLIRHFILILIFFIVNFFMHIIILMISIYIKFLCIINNFYCILFYLIIRITLAFFWLSTIVFFNLFVNDSFFYVIILIVLI